MYRLMMKTHNKTGLRYLCITKRSDWKSYSGSGVRWKKHLKAHGYDFSTDLLFESDDYELFVLVCRDASDFFDVVNSDDFANLCHEYGYDNTSFIASSNFVTYWENLPESEKLEIYSRRSDTLKERYQELRDEHGDLTLETMWNRTSDEVDEFKKDMSKRARENWFAFTDEEKERLNLDKIEGQRTFFASERSNKCRLRKSEIMKERHASIPFEERSKTMSERRLALSEEKKQRRAERCRAAYADGKHDELFHMMSEERKSIGNPAAKIVLWDGKAMTLKDFKAELKNLKIPYHDAILDSRYQKKYADTEKQYDIIKCPHCGKESNKKPSSFKRWHFDNCKEKVN